MSLKLLQVSLKLISQQRKFFLQSAYYGEYKQIYIYLKKNVILICIKIFKSFKQSNEYSTVPTTLPMPALSPTMLEGSIVQWLVKEGKMLSTIW